MNITRKELAAMMIDYQIKKGIVYPEDRTMQIQKRLVGRFALNKNELVSYCKAVGVL